MPQSIWERRRPKGKWLLELRCENVETLFFAYVFWRYDNEHAIKSFCPSPINKRAYLTCVWAWNRHVQAKSSLISRMHIQVRNDVKLHRQVSYLPPHKNRKMKIARGARSLMKRPRRQWHSHIKCWFAGKLLPGQTTYYCRMILLSLASRIRKVANLHALLKSFWPAKRRN